MVMHGELKSAFVPYFILISHAEEYHNKLKKPVLWSKFYIDIFTVLIKCVSAETTFLLSVL